MTRFVVGIDGGGTTTRVVILGEDGTELARASVAGSVVSAHDPHSATGAVRRALAKALPAGGLQGRAAVLWAGLAGAGRDEARTAVQATLEIAQFASRVVVGTDAEAAFHDAFREGPGMLLVAGTGSIAWGRGESGRTVRVGGWGDRIGDEGSGFWIGSEALRRVVRAEDGRSGPTALSGLVLDQLGLSDPQELVTWVGAATKREIASLVPTVVRAAGHGDTVADDVLEQAVVGLASHVEAALERSGPWSRPAELAFWGGIIEPGGPLRDRVARALNRFDMALLDRVLDPPMGAARRALALLE